MIFVLTGAGISVESGIPTYRAAEGTWAMHSIDQVATYTGFTAEPDFVRSFYDARLKEADQAEPNAAHLALARLEAESSVPVIIVTQNVDDLHERSGSRGVIHMHGKLGDIICASCGKPSISRMGSGHPPCHGCGGIMRPDIVWFGEMPKRLEEIQAAARTCSLFISIGTSGQVQPAASLVRKAKKNHAHRIEVNPVPTTKPFIFHDQRKGTAGTMVPLLVDEILSKQSRTPTP